MILHEKKNPTNQRLNIRMSSMKSLKTLFSLSCKDYPSLSLPVLPCTTSAACPAPPPPLPSTCRLQPGGSVCRKLNYDTAVYILCFHFLCAPRSWQCSTCCARFPHELPKAPNGVLIEGGRDKGETNCVHGPLPPSHSNFNLHQVLFGDRVRIRFLTPGIAF